MMMIGGTTPCVFPSLSLFEKDDTDVNQYSTFSAKHKKKTILILKLVRTPLIYFAAFKIIFLSMHLYTWDGRHAWFHL